LITRTRVVNCRTDPFDQYIGRAGHGQSGYYGNQFVVGRDGTREEVLERFLRDFAVRVEQDMEYRGRVKALKGLRLG
jgi:hypothetical protein